MIRKPFILLLLLLNVVSFSAQAVKLQKGDYRYREDVEAFIQKIAASSDYSEQQLLDLFSSVKHQRHLFERMDKPAEKLEWHQYRKIFMTDKRIHKGIEFWKNNRDLLQQVEQRYGVPAEFIVAIVGVETFYGAYKGKVPVFDTLVTFAFDYPKRAKFFTSELEHFLLLSASQKFDVREVKGSYAGAMGIPQFIASSYRSYAVDFDGDGEANLFDSLPDVLGSVANYFKRHGWESGAEVTHPLTLSAQNTISQIKTGVKPSYSWSELSRAGFSSSRSLPQDVSVALIQLQQQDGADYWAGQKNFYVITRYNHSELYAMAVYQLSQEIKAGMQL
ncbi:MAG: lytic murein transglycosylase B [Gammaproteobacteria bacterium]|nr:lytic murein transglycosylase B [Gammaproteobacteria bacterium]